MVAMLVLLLSHLWRFNDVYSLTRAELSSLQVIAECFGAAAAGWGCAAFLRRKTYVGFFEGIEWRPATMSIVTSGLIGICSCLLLKFVLTKRFDLSLRVADANRSLFLILLGTVVLQPFIEEVYFRGILFCGLSSKLGPLFSAGIVTIVFVALHAQHQWIVLPVAAVVGILRLVSRSTCCCFALHLFYNLGIVLWGVR
jgi:membrane protease YdiL (CAAX protease family)